MEIQFLAGIILNLAIFMFLLFNFFKHHDSESLKKGSRYFFYISIFYFILSVFSFLWLFKFLEYVESDFVFIYSLIILIETSLLFLIIFLVSKNKKLFYSLISYLIIFLFVLLLGIHFMVLFLIASFLFLLLGFLDLIFRESEFKTSGYLGIFYSISSIIFFIFFIANTGNFFVYTLISGLIFFIFIFYFMKNIKENPPISESRKETKSRGYFFLFLSHFVFMLVLINFVFIGTVVLHEFGHLLTSNFYECQNSKIVYEQNFPRTEITCLNLTDDKYVILGGLFLPLIIALTLFLVGGRFLKEIGLLIAGFNLVVSYQDFFDLGISDNLIMFFTFFGIFLSIAGIILLARSKTEDYIYSISQV